MPTKKAQQPELPRVFGTEWIRAAYGLTTQRKGAGKKNNPADPLDVRWLVPQPPGKKAEQQLAAAAAKALGLDPSDRVISAENQGKQLTGLRNLGATCYMNSLLQGLFMNPAFRRGIYAWRPADSAQNSVAQTIIRELQLLFTCLQRSHTTYYDPEKLSKTLNLDTTLQQDAQEFSKILLTFLEDQLRQCPDKSVSNLVQNQFQGEYCYRTTCQTCKRQSDSSSTRYPFYELELNLDPKGGTLEESLREYIKAEVLSGVECSHCSAKHDATRQMALLTLPPVLTLQLLRFVYDLATGTKKKVNAAVRFPARIDLSQFVDPDERTGDASEYEYQLTAVLMHTGSSANTGHYTARILEQTAAQPGGGGDAGGSVVVGSLVTGGDTDGTAALAE